LYKLPNAIPASTVEQPKEVRRAIFLLVAKYGQYFSSTGAEAFAYIQQSTERSTPGPVVLSSVMLAQTRRVPPSFVCRERFQPLRDVSRISFLFSGVKEASFCQQKMSSPRQNLTDFRPRPCCGFISALFQGTGIPCQSMIYDTNSAVFRSFLAVGGNAHNQSIRCDLCGICSDG